MDFFDFFAKPSKPMLGMDISSSAVKLIELSKTGDSFKVEAYRVLPLPPNTIVDKNIADLDALSETIAAVVKRSGTKLTDIVSAVSSSSVITKEIELPAGLTELQMEMQIEVEADQYIPYPMEEVAFDFDVLDEVENNPDLVRVLLAACRQENVEHRRQALEMAGFNPKVIDVESFAVERAYKPLTDAEVEEQSKKFAFNGERLTLDFQDIEVRSVLQIIAEFTSLNLVASDTVTGNITLWLDDVPWDQALEIILKAKGLDKRQEGNVLMVAPAAEIAEQERLQVEANKQLQELAPLETTFVRIKYADAAEIFELFTASRSDEGQSSSGSREGNATTTILSERGSAIVDERTNTIILTDTEDKINAFKRLIDEIDVPIKQVLIEARIVIANTDFKKELGVTWGLAGIDKLAGGTVANAFGDKTLGFSGRRSGLTPGAGAKETFTYSADEIETDVAGITTFTRNFDVGLADSLAVDLGVDNPTGSFSLGYLTDNFLIDLELSALESDGFGEIVSQPKVLAGDKQQAVIKSGTEIAYQKATSSGATSIEFKEAVLQLEVTPQITPDNRIIMDLLVSQDSVGAFTPTGEPSIDITQIETQALVGNGQTLVLGCIFQTEEVNGTDKVPLLGDLPFLGKLFRNDLRNIEKREILIFITPKIIDDNLLDR
jgi:type IV pilus assembly protein PilQ